MNQFIKAKGKLSFLVGRGPSRERGRISGAEKMNVLREKKLKHLLKQ